MGLVCTFDRKHRRIARINLRIAFPEMGDGEAERLIRRAYLRLGTLAAEFVHIPNMDERTSGSISGSRGWRTCATPRSAKGARAW
jgi:lauroyl/myristoyl acyltransferase